MEKINLVGILKICPKGTELYSPLCGDCKLYDVNDYGIRIETPNKDTLISLHHDGRYCSGGEIMLFPKGRTTWEGFVPPCKFKDGDIIYVKDKYNREWCSILNNCENDKLYTYVDLCIDNNTFYHADLRLLCARKEIIEYRLATEEEKQKLFKAIKDKGYKWNPETKTLEKLIEPKFKVGDRIKYIYFDRKVAKVVKIHDKRYELDNGKFLEFQDENAYEISCDKFDITTLMPFDKVLVRSNSGKKWTIDFFGVIDNYNKYPFTCLGHSVTQCIPYEGNQHLLDTTDDCDEFYKTWK